MLKPRSARFLLIFSALTLFPAFGANSSLPPNLGQAGKKSKQSEQLQASVAPEEGLKLSLGRKLAMFPGRFAVLCFERLLGYRLGQIEKARRLEGKIEHEDKKVSALESEVINHVSDPAARKGLEAHIEGIKSILKDTNKTREDKISAIKALANSGGTGSVDEKVFKAEFWKNLVRAPGEGWLKTDIMTDYLAEFPVYKMFSKKGTLPSKGALRWLARVAMVADPVVTGGLLFRAIDPVFRIAVLTKDPDLARDKCAEFFGEESADLGDPQNFVRADSLDSFKALPAIAEIALLKMAASLAVGSCIDEKGDINFGQLGRAIRKGDAGGIRKLWQKEVTVDGKTVKNKAWLPNQKFFKADVLAIYGYLKFCFQMVVGEKILKLEDPKVLEKVYKKTYGMIDSNFVSFLASLGAVHSLKTGVCKKVMNLKASDTDIVGQNLADYNTAHCILPDPEDCHMNRGKFKPREVEKAFGRYFFEKAVSRVLFGILKRVEGPVSGFCERSLNLSGMLFKMAKIEKVDQTKQMIKMFLFKKGKDGKKRLELPFYSFDQKGEVAGFPYKVCVGKSGIEMFLVEGTAKDPKETRVNDRVVFDFLSIALAEPTLKIKSERGLFMTKWLAEFLSYALVAPWLENSLCGENKTQFGIFEKRKRNPYQANPWKCSFRLATILAGWIILGSMKKWIQDGLESEDEEDEKEAIEKIIKGLGHKHLAQ